MFKDLRGYLKKLEEVGELVRVGEELSPKFEIPAAIRYITQNKGTAVFFEKVKGYDVPIVANLLGNRRRLALALGVKEEDLEESYRAHRPERLLPKMVSRAPVQEVVHTQDIDILSLMPVLTNHEKDASPYMSSAIALAKDPESGIRGMGLHRIQVKGKDRVGILLATPPLSHFVAKADWKKKPMEIAIISGADPVIFFASVLRAPQGIDKFEIAGALTGKPVELVKCQSVDLEVPAHAEFVLEGHLLPGYREKEGPFGESTGYYLTYDSPVAEIKVITHRRHPLYHALMPFGPEEEILISLPWGEDLLRQIRSFLPGAQKVVFRAMGEIVVVQIEKKSEEDASKVFDYLFSTTAAKIVVVTDSDVDISDSREVDWALATRLRPDKDITIKHDLPGLGIDPSGSPSTAPTEQISAHATRTSKLGLDATKPLAELEKYERIDLPAQVKKKVAKKMSRLLKAPRKGK